jgi:hypothetical protein
VRQVALNLGLRALLGVIGTAAVIAGVAIAVREVRSAALGSPLWPAIFLALFGLLIVCSGVLLLNGAWSGRMAVRDPRGRAFRQRR